MNTKKLDAARAVYVEALRDAQKAYDEARAAAWRAYLDATAPVWRGMPAQDKTASNYMEDEFEAVLASGEQEREE